MNFLDFALSGLGRMVSSTFFMSFGFHVMGFVALGGVIKIIRYFTSLN